MPVFVKQLLVSHLNKSVYLSHQPKTTTMRRLLLLSAVFAALSLGIACSDDDENPEPVTPEITNEECLAKHYTLSNNNVNDISSILLADYIYIGFSTEMPDSDIVNFINNQPDLVDIDATSIHIEDYDTSKAVVAQFTTGKTCHQIHSFINQMNANEEVLYTSYTYQSSFWIGETTYDVMTYGNLFYVRVTNADDLSALNATALETNTTIEFEHEFLEGVYIMSTSKDSDGDALDMANYFQQTGNFEFAEIIFYDYLLDENNG